MVEPRDPTSFVPRFAVYGLGRAGLTLTLALFEAGVRPASLWEHDPVRAQAAAGLLSVPVCSGPPAPLQPARPHDATDVLLLAVADRHVTALARELAATLPDSPRACVALHLAGALDATALQPLAARGVCTGSLHPLRSMPDPLQDEPSLAPGRAAALLRGVSFAVEPPTGLAAGAARWLVERLGGRGVSVEQGGKPAYHAAAALASNGLVTLLHEASRLACGVLVEQEQALPLLLDLAQGALAEVRARGTVAALTGPVLRGDAGTIGRHVEALRGDPACALYRELTLRTIELAREAGAEQEALERVEQELGDQD